MAETFVVEPLANHHDRAGFRCGVEALDRYFHRQVTQDIRRRATACYVAVEAPGAGVAGYYTLAAAGIPLGDLPPELARRLPRYPSVPAARLGRLAVGLAHRGRKLGSALLWDAIERSCRSQIAVLALVVDAKDDQAAAFYTGTMVSCRLQAGRASFSCPFPALSLEGKEPAPPLAMPGIDAYPIRRPMRDSPPPSCPGDS